MRRLAGLAALAALVPAPAAACAVCLTSAYGDRSFNWAFVVLMLMPFVVAVGLSVALFVLAGGGSRVKYSDRLLLIAGCGKTPQADQKGPDAPTTQMALFHRPAKPEREVARC